MRHGLSAGHYWLYRTVCPVARKQVEIRIGLYKPPAETKAAPNARKQALIVKYGTADLVSIEEARHIWQLLDARRKQDLTFTDDDGAALRIENMLAKNPNGQDELTVGWLCAKYLSDYANAKNVNGDPVKRSAHDDELLIDRYILPDHAETSLADFTAPVIDDLLDTLGNATRQRQKLYSLLNVMNSVSRKNPPGRAKIEIKKRWIPAEIPNPMGDVTRVIGRDAISYASTPEEVARYTGNIPALWDPQHDQYRVGRNCDLDRTRADEQMTAAADALLLQVQTLSRIGEITDMKWAEVDLDTGVWTLPAERAKNKRAHRVYLSTQSIELLERRRANTESEWVFPSMVSPENSISKHTPVRAIANNRELLGVDEHFTSHATRRAGLSWMRANGIPKETRDAISNHTPPGVDAAYTKTADMESLARPALQSWCDFIHGTLTDNVINIGVSR